MYRNMLVPLDGTPFSEQVLAHVLPFITPRQTRLLLLRVVAPQHAYADFGNPGALMMVENRVMENEWAESERYLEGVQEELRKLGIRARTKVAGGDVTTAICATADCEAVDLIAMTTHGRSGVSRWAMGSVADHVVRVAQQPVLLARGASGLDASEGLQRILVPLDGSELAEQALPQAQTLAREKGATLLLLRAVDLKSEQALDGVGGHSALRTLRTAAAQRYLARISARLQQEGVASQIQVAPGSPDQTILQVAQAEAVDLIVMSTHARSGLGRWVHGSVADTVLRGAPSPVLLVRSQVSAVHVEQPVPPLEQWRMHPYPYMSGHFL